MKKPLILLVIIAIVALGALPVLATPAVDLNVLARYFPADTPVFISVRTDDGFIETVDAVVAKVGATFPDAMPPMTLSDVLDQGVSQLYQGGNFDQNVRTWLGDTASMAVLSLEASMDQDRSNDDQTPVIFAVSIKDRTAAVDFVSTAFESGGEEFTQVQNDNYTLFTNSADADVALKGLSAILVRDDVLMITNDAANLPIEQIPASALDASAAFTDALTLLPEDSYNMTVYTSLSDVMQAAIENNPEMQGAFSTYSTMFSAIGPQVWGFTILDGVSLTIDIAQKVGDLSATGLTMGSIKPLNPDFSVHIPASAPLAIHGTDLKTSIGGALDNLTAMTEMMAEMPGANVDMSPEQMQQGIQQLEQAFTAITGLDLRQDMLEWMSGDYALFLGLNPAIDTSSMMGLMTAFPVDFGLAIEATDAAAAQATVEGLTRGLNQTLAMAGLADSDATEEPGANRPQIEITSEDMAGASITVLTVTSREIPWPVELLMGANDKVFALGTRNAVTAILNPDGGLPSNPEYARAQAFMLDNPVSVAWLGTESLLPLADLAGAFGPSRGGDNSQNSQVEQIRSAINLFSSGTISATMDADGNSIARLVLTFGE